MGIGTGVAGMSQSIQQLAQARYSELDHLHSTVQNLQNRLDSPTEVSLQNQIDLGLITLEKGGICILLWKQYFYIKKENVVQKLAQLRDGRKTEELILTGTGIFSQTGVCVSCHG